ncbi:MAG: hypothetical protein D6771_03070, partial [Zetaproteobacteria bacterium]
YNTTKKNKTKEVVMGVYQPDVERMVRAVDAVWTIFRRIKDNDLWEKYVRAFGSTRERELSDAVHAKFLAQIVEDGDYALCMGCRMWNSERKGCAAHRIEDCTRAQYALAKVVLEGG